MMDAIPADTNGINTYNEKHLHSALKQWYAQPDDRLEVKVDGYVIDLVRGDLLVEFQTGSFNPLKRKLHRLAESHPVRLVFPVALEKWIITYPQEPNPLQAQADTFSPEAAAPTTTAGAPLRRRKSPKRGCVEQVFAELVYIPTLLAHDNFSLEVLLIREEEVRRFAAPKRKRRWRKDWVTTERRLLEVIDRRVFQNPRELVRLLPEGLPEPFTVRDVAKATSQPVWLAGKMVYCFREMGLIIANGRKGRAIRYSRAEKLA